MKCKFCHNDVRFNNISCISIVCLSCCNIFGCQQCITLRNTILLTNINMIHYLCILRRDKTISKEYKYDTLFMYS